MKLILGSSSKSRLEILAKICDIKPIIISPDIDEMPKKSEKPINYAKRVAFEKMESVKFKIKQQHPEIANDCVIICADTVCARGRLIMPKGETEDDVRYCMEKLSGRSHDVFTAVCALNMKTNQLSEKISETKIKFKSLSERDISDMINSGSGIGNAGGYTVKGLAESFIIKMQGSHSGVVGFPMYHVRNILISFGII